MKNTTCKMEHEFNPIKNPRHLNNSGGWVYQGSLILIEGPVKGWS